MKKLFAITAIFMMGAIWGCASTGFLMAKPKVVLYGNAYTSKSDNAPIDVFRISVPNQEYIEIAQITCGDTDDAWNMQQILNEARKIGADGVILGGQVGSMGVGIGQSNIYSSGSPTVMSTSTVVSQGYGMAAVAIRYKSSPSIQPTLEPSMPESSVPELSMPPLPHPEEED